MTTVYKDVHHQYINIPKCAGTSVLTAMGHLESYTIEDVRRMAKNRLETAEYDPKGPPAFTIIRHPWRRFVSTWKNKVRYPHRPDTMLLKMGVPKGTELDKFCQWFLHLSPEERNGEAHLRPQHMYLPENLTGIDVIIQEDLPLGWYRGGYHALYGKLPRRNSTRGMAETNSPYRRQVEDLYQKDMKLWLDSFK
jgi:hypothetical protein